MSTNNRGVILLRSPKPLDQVGALLRKNREEYAQYHGFTCIYDDSEFTETRHYTWATAYKILEVLSNKSLDFDWMCYIGNEVIVNNFNIHPLKIMDSISNTHSVFALGEHLFPLEGAPNYWFKENSTTHTLELVVVDYSLYLVSACGIIIRRTQDAINFFERIINDPLFQEEPTLKILPPHLDRFQIALSYYYENYEDVHDILCVRPASEYACLPKGEGEVYQKLRKIMKKVVRHHYAEYFEDSFTTTIWCLSGGIDLPSIAKIVEEASTYIKR